MKNLISLLIILIFFSEVYSNNIHIIYTANINAALENCNCGNNPLGGVDRIKSFVDTYKKHNPNTILIDGGNFFNSYAYEELNNAMLRVIPILKYDMIVPGSHLFLEEKSFYDQYVIKFKNILLCSYGIPDFKDFHLIKLNKVNLKFYYFIDPGIFKYSKKPEWLELKSNLNNNSISKKDINILIFHGYLESAEKFLKDHPAFDPVLLSHDQRKDIWKINDTKIIGCGHDAESIAIIEINDKKSKEVNIEFKSMDKNIASDPEIMKLISRIKLDLDSNAVLEE